MTTTGDILEPDFPFPPRFRWTKRIVVASILLILGYAGVMWWLRLEARRRLDDEIAAIRARGEPILVEDFQSNPVPDEVNAAYSLLTAATSMTLTQAELDYTYQFDLDSTVDAKGMQLLGQIAQGSAPARKLARLARFQNEVDWNIKYVSPVITTLLPHLNKQRELINVLQFDARYEHLAGNDAEAIELARDMLWQSNTLQRDHPVLVTHLVGLGNGSRAYGVVRVLSHDLQVLPDTDATTQPTGPASRNQVRALIAELLDETELRRGAVMSLQTERMLEYDCAVNPGSLGVWGPNMVPILGITYRPVFDLDAVRIMRNTTQVMNAAKTDNWPAAEAALPNVEKQFASGSAATGASRLLSRVIMPSFSRALRSSYRNLTERRVASLRLAIRLYQLDHGGRFPARLEELVPDYIGSIPVDPFAADGRAFGYRAAPQPLIYSVGNDGVDSGGDTAPLSSRIVPTTAPAGSPDDDRAWDRRDVPFPLDRYVRPPPTTAEN